MNPEIKKMYEDYFDKCFRESSPTQQEPVAWVCNGTNGHHDIDFFEEDVDSLSVGTQLYTTPPQRKPLTDEEIYSLADSLEIWNEDDEEWILDPNTFARAIEAAHGIKEIEK